MAEIFFKKQIKKSNEYSKKRIPKHGFTTVTLSKRMPVVSKSRIIPFAVYEDMLKG